MIKLLKLVPERRTRPLRFALVAVLSAISAFVLPAVDAVLPGGAILWQLFALTLTAATAYWAFRTAKSPAGRPIPGIWLVRVMVIVAVVLALLWVGGVAALWLLWPR